MWVVSVTFRPPLPVEKFHPVPIVKEPYWLSAKSVAIAGNITPITWLFSLYRNVISTEISNSLCWLIPTDLCVWTCIELTQRQMKHAELQATPLKTHVRATHASSHCVGPQILTESFMSYLAYDEIVVCSPETVFTVGRRACDNCFIYGTLIADTVS
jgi:hypothetical protein